MEAGPVLRMRDELSSPHLDGELLAGHPRHQPPAGPVSGLGGLVPGSGHRRRPSPHHKALVLNATMEPLCVVPARRALVLVLNDKADVIQTNGHRYRSEREDHQAPSVVRLRRFVHVPYRRRAALSRRGVFIRDNFTCQYCGRAAENVDHVVPRSRGGPHEWENVVAACRRCNSKKMDLMPAECGMVLRRAPFAPRAAFWLVVAVGGFHDDWQPYLGDPLAAL